jgi:hypothetical protein
VRHELELVLPGKECLVEFARGQIDADRRKGALLEPEDAAGAEVDLDRPAVGSGVKAEPGRVFDAFLAAIAQQRAEIGFELQVERRVCSEQRGGGDWALAVI